MYPMLINNVAQVLDPVHANSNIFPSRHIAYASAECSKPVEYVACAPPKFC
jgi:hypothetical protein